MPILRRHRRARQLGRPVGGQVALRTAFNLIYVLPLGVMSCCRRPPGANGLIG